MVQAHGGVRFHGSHPVAKGIAISEKRERGEEKAIATTEEREREKAIAIVQGRERERVTIQGKSLIQTNVGSTTTYMGRVGRSPRK